MFCLELYFFSNKVIVILTIQESFTVNVLALIYSCCEYILLRN